MKYHPCSIINRSSTLEINFEQLVYECAREFGQLAGWSKHANYENMLKYSNTTEKLLEILEVLVCGSVGGFDSCKKDGYQHITKNQRYSGRTKFQRFLWIWDKYTSPEFQKKYKSIIEDLEKQLK